MKLIHVKLVNYFFLVLVSICFSQQVLGQPVEYFSSQRNINNNYPFSNAVRVGDLLFLSGELGTLPNSSKLIKGEIKKEARQTMDNIQASLAKHSLSINDLVKCTVMLADIKIGPFSIKYIKAISQNTFLLAVHLLPIV